MPETPQNLGKLISVHGTSPAFLQRAAIVAILSFFFFLTMLIAFYIRQQFGYFVLSSSFLAVYLFTMIGWWMQKRNVVSIYENGITHRKFIASWDEIESSSRYDQGIRLISRSGFETVLPGSINNIEQLAVFISSKIQH